MRHLFSSFLSKPLQYLTLLGVFMAPLKTTAFAIGFLVLVDLATGIWASVKRGEPITSDRMVVTVRKSFLYLLALIVAHVAETYVFSGVPLLKVIAGMIGATELLSFSENFEAITGVPLRKRLGALLGREQKDKSDGR